MQDSPPRVSVCVPSFNHAHYIGKCVESVLAQTVDSWELVIVDNHSTDNTEEVVRSFKDPRIRFYRNDRNIGPAPNWNRCVSLARGDYAAILQSDDMYLPRMLQRSTSMLDSNPRVGLVHSGFHRIDPSGAYIDTKLRWASDRVMKGSSALRELLESCYITPSTVVMRRDHCLELGGFDESYRFNLDWSMWMRMALTHDFGYVAEPLALQRSGHPGSQTMSEVMRRPQSGTSEEIRVLADIFRRLPATREWREARRKAYRNVMYRHNVRSLWLLHHDETAAFRSAIAFAIRANHRYPLRYRKMMALWAGSAFGARPARWLDLSEQRLWHVLRGGQEPTVVEP